MKYLLLYVIATAVLFLTSCGPSEEPGALQQALAADSISATGEPLSASKKDTIWVDKTYTGMTMKQLREIYKDLEFTEEPLFAYGVDSEDNGWLLSKNKQPFIFVWSQEKSDTIHSITILSEEIVIDGNVHTGMTMGDFFRKYPSATLGIDEISYDTEYAFVPGKNYSALCLTTDSTRIGAYNFSEGGPEFIKLKQPQARIQRIAIYR